MITVKELIKKLSIFDPNSYVAIYGGESEIGDWAELLVCEDEDDVLWQSGEVILEYEN